MAFGLKLRKPPRKEIDRRVRETAATLGLADQLKKKPRSLSGGQRQRVAMGRAIVREPKAFLMDEPLSNLDAKLRVQMRTEISRIQRDLGVTMIYVTHDQDRGDEDGRHGRRDGPGRAAAGGHAAGHVRRARQPVRGGVHRLPVDEHGRGDARPRRRPVFRPHAG
jgi:ABC-type thiamine transport system ATPase subunit